MKPSQASLIQTRRLQQKTSKDSFERCQALNSTSLKTSRTEINCEFEPVLHSQVLVDVVGTFCILKRI